MRISDWSSDVCSSDLVVRRAPESHHRVPHVLVERAAAGIDRRGHKGKVVIEEIGGVTRRETLAGGGEADDVGEHHGNRALLGLDSALAEADEAHDQAPRHVGLEPAQAGKHGVRSEEHTSELQSLMRISYAVFCLNKKN